jgi:hypothetical protein
MKGRVPASRWARNLGKEQAMRNLKVLCLALVAVLALSAMAASAAQANEKADFWAANENSTIDAVADTTQEFTIEGWPTITCTEVNGAGMLAKEGPELTANHIATSYKMCHTVAGFTFPVTVDMNGCHYLFTAGTYTKNETGGAGLSDGTAHIQCGAGKEITITVMSLSHETVRCTAHVKPQTAKGFVTFRNETTEKVMAITAVSHTNVEAVTTNGGVLGCEKEVKDKEAKYRGSFWAKATNASNLYIDGTVTGTPL